MNIKNFRLISILEGISYLLLFGVTMPLKYMADFHGPNKIIGMIHGILFITYVAMALVLQRKQNWSYATLFIILMCSVVPFGTFWMERRYLRPA
ncbi:MULTISPECIES: DUF3817 domain-containing protein [Galbibacter]|uniref:DUF3817 domain-containing protein n=1 Tax=Galbibacter pacificus TaxID=2996052 RepID=A0ABT6FQR4_9FLAO|nr:DUF3817 domain-containing protein [Galbibacter pacificus]MDG3582083.1 DUF3817 domain-containing protein [Galbibacter pacificus]MDG3585441.1 DUF3817 domain-containing protein [Galbibacter pacificus]